MNHKSTFRIGTDARNHVARCECGWAHPGTYLMARERANAHAIFFSDEDRDWNDPRRQADTPSTSYARVL